MAGKKQVAPWLARERQLYVEEWCLSGFHENGREYQRRKEDGTLETLRVRHDGTDETTYTPIPAPVPPAAEAVPVKAPKVKKPKKQKEQPAAQAEPESVPVEAPTVTDAA